MSFFYQYHNNTDIIHNQKINFEPHLHNEIEIIALFEGNTLLTVDGKDYQMSAGDFLIVFPNTIHSYTSETDVDVGKFIFSPETIPELKGVFNSKRPKNPIISEKKAEGANLLNLSKEILNFYDNSCLAVKKAYLLLLIGKILEICELEEKPKSNNIINLIFDYCQNNYRNNIKQKDVAKALHISESYLSHVFMYKIKINFCNYINILRVNEASELLRQSEKSITEIAEESGFSSLRTFNRAFVRYKEITPKEYRKSLY